MKAVLTLALKDLRVLLRDKFALFWILAFPLMFALFFGSIFGDGGGGGSGAINLTVVDEDDSVASRALVERLAANTAVRLPRTGEGPDAALERLDRASAHDAVRKGRRAAYLLIPAGFGDNPYAIFAGGADGSPQIELGIDPRRQAEAGALQGVLMEALFGSVQARMLDPEQLSADLAGAREEIARNDDLATGQRVVLLAFLGALDSFVQQFDMSLLGGDGESDGDGEDAPGGMSLPLAVVDVSRDTSGEPRSAFDITMPQAMVWGLMSVAVGFAVTLVRERSAGTLLRLSMAPVGVAQILGGKALASFLACLATMLLLTLVAVVALGVQVQSPALYALAMVCTAACFTGLMMTVSVMGRTEASVSGASMGLMMPFAMIGGGMIPLIAMPAWMHSASVISPFRWSIDALEGAVWRDYGMAEMALPCAVLLGIGAVFFALGVAIFKRMGV